jgi:regulator of protease activity HflC (stomatin/prohibitin superfamily)
MELSTEKGGAVRKIAFGVGAVLLAVVLFKMTFVYNEAGYQTHIRTIFGDEKVATDVGYTTYWFGRSTAWKQAQSVQFNSSQNANDGGDETSGSVVDYKVVFLGNVDGVVEASTRFRLPQGEQFLKIAREYRTPENFIATALTPAIKETLQSTASLMSADDYFSGARSEFGSEFENQLRQGQYLTTRKEVTVNAGRHRNQPSGLTSGGDIPGVDDDVKRSEFVTEKVLNPDGTPKRKTQQFIAMGVDVIEARITNIDPNHMYKDRMIKVQAALADLAVARQGRLKEEEEKLLVTARGEKEVEQKRQETLRDQIEQTTRAETDRKLTVINAERERAKADIEKQTAALYLDKARIDADATKVAADAEAYAKEAVIKADGALDKKLAAMVSINEVWAKAATSAPVPGVVMGGSGTTGRQNEIQDMMSIMAVKAAKDLQLDMAVKSSGK